jgi:hypothetical protein
MSKEKRSKVEEKPQATEEIAVAPDPEAAGNTLEKPHIQDELQAESVPALDLSTIDRLDPDSLAARWLLEKRSVIRELHHAYVHQVIFYTKPGQRRNGGAF